MTNVLLQVLFTLVTMWLGWRTGTMLRPHLFRLAERLKRAHLRPAAAVTPASPLTLNRGDGGSTAKEETLPELNTVQQLLASAEGGAEALLDCGAEVDDTELVGSFITAMDEAHAACVEKVDETLQRMLANGVPPEALNDKHSVLVQSLKVSPCGTSLWLLWRIASMLKRQASADVLEAAREVVRHANSPRFVERDKAIAKLAAALPKED